MDYKIEISKISTAEEVEGYWAKEDYVQLLEKFNYPDASNAESENLSELLSMAITDYEPREAALIVLEYKLSNLLNEGQIQQISSDMLIDKVCEEYPEIDMQVTLFSINQLLYKAFNGKFPNAKATVVDFSMIPLDEQALKKLSAENVLKLFSKGLSESNIIMRLFYDQMHENADFPTAENIVWVLQSEDDINYKLITSENWLKKEDFLSFEFNGVLQDKIEEV